MCMPCTANNLKGGHLDMEINYQILCNIKYEVYGRIIIHQFHIFFGPLEEERTNAVVESNVI